MAAPSMGTRIGLMGGTFDPIHYGHLFIAEEARVRCGLSRVIFFPNGQPAHAEGKLAAADAEERLAMTELAIASNPHFLTSRLELDRPGKSYAYDTVLEFQEQLGAGVELYFIVGADSLREILTWYRGDQILDLCRFIVASRPGFDAHAALAQLSRAHQQRVTLIEVPGLDIASRDLRARVAEGRPVRYLIPDSVLGRIDELGLYRQ